MATSPLVPVESTVLVPTGTSLFGDQVQGYDLWSSKRHTGWKRQRHLVYEALRRTHEPPSRVRNFCSCGQGGLVLRRTDRDDQYAVVPKHCHDRFCQPCSRQRAWLIRRNLSPHVPDHPCRFVTLTLLSTHEPLQLLIDRLRDAFTALRNHPFWKEHVRGGLAFLEVKRSKSGLRWHPHLHIICDGKYIPKYELSEIWRQITGDSYIVDVSLIREQRDVLRYVTKYSTKPMDAATLNDPGYLAECILAMKGRKLCGAFGDWTHLRLLQPDAEGDWELLCNLDGLNDLAEAGNPHALRVRQFLTNTAHVPVEWRYSTLPPPELYVTNYDGLEHDYEAFQINGYGAIP